MVEKNNSIRGLTIKHGDEWYLSHNTNSQSNQQQEKYTVVDP